MAFNQDVYNFVAANIGSPSTILAAMNQFGVDVNQLADAIGYSPSQVVSYFQNAGIVAPGMGQSANEQPQSGQDSGGQVEQPVYQPPPVYTATDGTTFSSESDRNNYQTAINAQQKLRTDAQAIGINLPSAWFVMTPQQQFDWYVSNKFGSDKLKALGVTDANLLKAVDDANKPVTVADVVNTISPPVNQATNVTTPTLQPWQKLDVNGNIVTKTWADYTVAEMVPFAQNVINQRKAEGTYISPAQFQTFAAQQGVPASQIPALIASLTFPTAPVTTPPVTTPPVTTPPVTTPVTTGPKPLSAYTSAEMIPYIQNLYRDNPNVSAQMVRQYALSQNVPAGVIDAALSSVQVPTANFSQFTVGGGNTRLATPTNDFFYGAGPTQQAPYMFRSGAAGYTRLLPQSLEFGIPAVTGTKPTFQPGIFDAAALQKKFESQSGITYGGETISTTGINQGAIDQQQKENVDQVKLYKGGKVKSLLGPDPGGPDEGYAALQKGEYVVRKKAVNKYGEDFLEALNESRIPKNKAKGLL